MTMLSGTIMDTVGNPFQGLSVSQYFFSTSSDDPPRIVSYRPAVFAVEQPNTLSIVLTFSKDVFASSMGGNIVITPSGGGGENTPVSISINDATQVLFSNNTVTIKPTNALDNNGVKTHTVTMACGVIFDGFRIPFAGLNGSAYSFITSALASGETSLSLLQLTIIPNYLRNRIIISPNYLLVQIIKDQEFIKQEVFITAVISDKGKGKGKG